ncbi:MAG: HipA N-terminal domain-containing protein [Eggerthellaceae bacterium]|nr:HipA N-terminal domain-containing protein [Eggerthellaceae bacterium]
MLESPANGPVVLLDGQRVGMLAQTPEGQIAFQYSPDWLRSGFSISPRSLPLESRVFVANWQPFGGLFGVFHDSLPDGWGALLLDRMLAKQGFDPAEVGPLVRLSIVGSQGRGGLCYERGRAAVPPHVLQRLCS